jgi:hypothetical protein
MAGAPIGNENARDGRIWRDAIRRAILADDGRKLRALAERLLEKAAEGDVAALKEVGDRIDGKSAQMIGVGQDPNAGPMQITRIERAIVGNAQD